MACASVALLLAIPLASAEWTGRGYYEPDTARDVTGAHMHLNPDVDPNPNVRTVYFNVQAYQDDHQVNPNVGAVGSRIMAYPTRMHAMLGVWKDCNLDGYVGNQEGFLLWYPSQLLPTNHVCPATTVDYSQPHPQIAHNDGATVREWFSIGPDDREVTAADDFQFNINDTDARIWGDWNLPEDGAFATCPLTPVPHATAQSTGGFLRYADCHVAWRGTTTVNSASNLTGTAALIGFHDAPRERPDQSQSQLNRPNPWGHEEDATMARAFDCDNPIVLHDDTGLTRQAITDPTGDDLNVIFGADHVYYVNLTNSDYELFLAGSPTVPTVDPNGSPAGTLNETSEATFLYRQVATGDGTCDREDDNGGYENGEIYELVEAEHEGVTGARGQTDFYFDYFEGGDACGARVGRPTTNVGPVDEAVGGVVPNPIFESEDPATCSPDPQHVTAEGAHAAYAAQTTDTWFGNPSYTSSRNPYVNKETLQPWGASYATFYASVSAPGLTLPDGFGTYGGGHCSNGSPITGLWRCDPSQWWRNPDGSSMLADENARQGLVDEWRVTVGKTFQLRDIDCYDQTVARGTPSVLSIVGERACERPA